MVTTLFLLASAPAGAPALTAPQIVDRMLRADDERRAALAGYAGLRHYVVENKKFDKRGEMTVRVTCASDGTKTFEIVQETGSGFVRNKVIRKMLDAERDASQKGEHEQTRIMPENYEFQLITTEMSGGRANYILEIRPKTNNKFLIRGRIWVDAEDFAITRVEGTPAKNPSFWVHRVEIRQEYERVGKFWLPTLNRTHAEVRIFGPSDVEIKYFDYVPKERQLALRALEPDRP